MSEYEELINQIVQEENFAGEMYELTQHLVPEPIDVVHSIGEVAAELGINIINGAPSSTGRSLLRSKSGAYTRHPISIHTAVEKTELNEVGVFEGPTRIPGNVNRSVPSHIPRFTQPRNFSEAKAPQRSQPRSPKRDGMFWL